MSMGIQSGLGDKEDRYTILLITQRNIDLYTKHDFQKLEYMVATDGVEQLTSF